MTQLYKAAVDGLVAVPQGKLASESFIEGWIANDPTLLGIDVMLIGRQVRTDHGGVIDLLGIDEDGNLAIVELKRDRTPREIVAQSLDYASWVAALAPPDVHVIAQKYLKRTLDAALRSAFKWLLLIC